MQRAAGEKGEKGEKRMTPPLAPSPPPALARPKSTSTPRSSRRATLTEEALSKAADHGGRAARPSTLDVSRVQAAEDDAKTELMANSPVRPKYYTTMPPVQRSSVPPVPPLPPKLLKAKGTSKQRHTLAPPSRGGAGGGWRDDWNNLADQTGIRPRTRSNSSSGDGQRTYTMSNYAPSSTMTSHSSAAPMLSTRQLQQQHQQYQQYQQQQRPGTSSSHYSTASRSQYGPVQYPIIRASGVPWRPPTRSGNSYQQSQDQQRRTLSHSPSSSLSSNASSISSSASSLSGSMTLRTPKPIAGLRAAAQQRAGGSGPGPAPATTPPSRPPRRKLQRKASNFSRPITPSDGMSNNGLPKTASEFV